MYQRRPLTEKEEEILALLISRYHDPLKIEPLVETMRNAVRDLLVSAYAQGKQFDSKGARLLGMCRTTYRRMRIDIETLTSFSHPRGNWKCLFGKKSQ